MGAIAGVYAESSDPSQVVHELLQKLRHRGTKEAVCPVGENTAIGGSSNQGLKELVSQTPQIAVAVNGSFYQREDPARFVLASLKKSALRSGVTSLISEPGGFAILAAHDAKMLAFRDPNGLKPLYLAKNKELLAFASERKALWRIGFTETKRVFPGVLYTAGRRHLRESQITRFRRPRERQMTLDQARAELVRALECSIRRITKGLSRVAVAFSGGLDSAVTAALAKSLCEVELISVGLSDSPELLSAEQHAAELGLPITLEPFSKDDLENYVRRVVWLIEEPSLMKVSVAIPLHWAAMLAGRKGHSVMLCGQGSDELYGGYYKYARTLGEKGRSALRAELYRSVVEAAEVNYERDEQATSPSGVGLRTPFADMDVIRLSLTIPSEFKVKKGNDVTRKWVLRAAAKDLGVPDSLAWRRKKAIQHGTGVENAIVKLAKSRNLSANAYLAKIFEEVSPLDTIP